MGEAKGKRQKVSPGPMFATKLHKEGKINSKEQGRAELGEQHSETPSVAPTKFAAQNGQSDSQTASPKELPSDGLLRDLFQSLQHLPAIRRRVIFREFFTEAERTQFEALLSMPIAETRMFRMTGYCL